MWKETLIRPIGSTLNFLWRTAWPLLLGITMVAIVAFVFMTMGLIQLQLQFHQRLLQDTRLNREIVRLLVDQLVTIDDFEYNKGIQSNLSTVLNIYKDRDFRIQNAGRRINLLCSVVVTKMEEISTPNLYDKKANAEKGAADNKTDGISQAVINASSGQNGDDLKTDRLDKADQLAIDTCVINVSNILSDQGKLKFSVDTSGSTVRRQLLREIYNYVRPALNRGASVKSFDDLFPSDSEYTSQVDNLIIGSIVSYNEIDYDLKQIDAQKIKLNSAYTEYCNAISSYTKMASENNADILLSALRARWTRSKCDNSLDGFGDQFAKASQFARVSLADQGPVPQSRLGAPQNLELAKPSLSTVVPNVNNTSSPNSSIEAQSDELVAAYRFYREARWIGLVFDYLITAPIDLSFIVIVFFASILGSVLRLVYDDIQAQKNPNQENGSIVQNKYKYRMQQLIVGVMVSLLFYVLSRTALISLLDRSVSENTFALNPYLVAFVAAVAGILSNETFEQIIATGRKIFKTT